MVATLVLGTNVEGRVGSNPTIPTHGKSYIKNKYQETGNFIFKNLERIHVLNTLKEDNLCLRNFL